MIHNTELYNLEIISLNNLLSDPIFLGGGGANHFLGGGGKCPPPLAPLKETLTNGEQANGLRTVS